jgi:hypothetical protein
MAGACKSDFDAGNHAQALIQNLKETTGRIGSKSNENRIGS